MFENIFNSMVLKTLAKAKNFNQKFNNQQQHTEI